MEAEGARVLAKAIVSRACMDMIALTFPSVCKSHLVAWKKLEDAEVSRMRFDRWILHERNQIRSWFDSEGHDLATMIDMDVMALESFSGRNAKNAERAFRLANPYPSLAGGEAARKKKTSEWREGLDKWLLACQSLSDREELNALMESM